MFSQQQKEMFMRRALELARNGRAYASPNPMVGAVIVSPECRVIGEGWHRQYGQGHAEVNAVASVSDADIPLLRQSTMFVTLEPCSHYGKTPPCAKMIVERGIPNVVVAMTDPNPKVGGRGIGILLEAGVNVEVGLLEHDAFELNRKFLTAMMLHRPFITLKWARSTDGFMDWKRNKEHPDACRFSTALTSITTMKLRAEHDAILTTSSTVIADNPSLTLRNFDGRAPRPVVLAHNTPLPNGCKLSQPDCNTIIFSGEECEDLEMVFQRLYSEFGITSVLVEAGPTLLSKLIEMNLWDEAREEISPIKLATSGTKKAPEITVEKIVGEEVICTGENGTNKLLFYRNNM